MFSLVKPLYNFFSIESPILFSVKSHLRLIISSLFPYFCLAGPAHVFSSFCHPDLLYLPRLLNKMPQFSSLNKIRDSQSRFLILKVLYRFKVCS